MSNFLSAKLCNVNAQITKDVRTNEKIRADIPIHLYAMNNVSVRDGECVGTWYV